MEKISKEIAKELISRNTQNPTEKQKNIFNKIYNEFLNYSNGIISSSYIDKENKYILIKEPKKRKRLGATTYIYIFYAECYSVERSTYNEYGCFNETTLYYKY